MTEEQKAKIPTIGFILDRVRKGQGADWQEGRFLLMGMKGVVNAAYSQAFLQRLLEHKVGREKLMELSYAHGKFQAQEGVRIFNKRFGYGKSFSEVTQLLDVHLGQFQLVGAGKFEWVVKDIKNKKFIAKGRSNAAEEYVLYFSTEGKCVDHFVRGLMAGFISETVGKNLYCVKTACVANGKPECTFVIQEKSKFDQKSAMYEDQRVDDQLDLLKELSPKQDPLL
jgi:hypothetical protein